MHPADIKAALNKAGCSMKMIADWAGVNQSAVSHVVYGRSTAISIAIMISKETGFSLEKIWPGRYRKMRLPEKGVEG